MVALQGVSRPPISATVYFFAAPEDCDSLSEIDATSSFFSTLSIVRNVKLIGVSDFRSP